MATKAPEPTFEEIERAKDREVVREERRALTAIEVQDVTTAQLRNAFVPQNMAEAMQFARTMAGSNFVPAHLRGKEGDCLAVLLIASRWGMDAFAVALKTYFVKDGAPPAFEAQLINAVVNSSGVLSGRLRISFEGEGDKLRCTVSGFLRADPGDEKIRTQSSARITTKNSPLWKNDPEQQLAYYTTRAWARLFCPEVLLGVYTPDEMEIDPERARNITPPMPRRDHIPDLGGTPHDSETGEILPEDEDTARDLDREGLAAMDGRTNGDDAVDTRGMEFVDELVDRLTRAAVAIDLVSVGDDWGASELDISEGDRRRYDSALAATRKRLGVK